MAKSEPVVQAPRRVVALDVDRHGLPGARAFRQDLLHQQPADAAATELRQQRDVGDPDVLVAAIDVEAPDGSPVKLDHQELAVGVVLLVVRPLRGELHVEEPTFLLVGPGDQAHLAFTRGAVEMSQERCVGLGAGPKRNRVAADSGGDGGSVRHRCSARRGVLRDGKIPRIAMKKFAPARIGTGAWRFGSAKVVFPSPPYNGAEAREERGVLRDGHQLPIAPRPAVRREVAREHTDFCDKRVRHLWLLPVQ